MFLDRMRRESDPAADDAVAQLFESGSVGGVNELLRELLRNDQTVPEELPAPLREYFRVSARLPDWADRRLIAKGQTVLEQHGLLCLGSLACASLPACYVSEGIAKVLGLTQRLESEQAVRRIYETAQFTMDVLRKGGLDAGGRGIRSAQKVRLMHAAIRHLAKRPPVQPRGDARSLTEALAEARWDTNTLGEPICQEDLAYTLQTFCWVVVRSIETLGADLDDDEKQAFVHAWNVVGHIMGIRHELLPSNIREAEELFELIWNRRKQDTPEGRLLTAGVQDFVLHALRREPILKPALESSLFDNRRLPRAIIRTLAKPRTADLLGLPPFRWWEHLLVRSVFKIVRRFVGAADDAADEVVILALVRKRFGGRILEHLTRHSRQWKDKKFDIPPELTAAAGRA